ncbi:MAG TPA: twin-arginine translocase subunit TatC [Chthoniobacterales bacterium]|nr:twin-arginine translocase subunit TatC [Chthoniobacterales bacterium]
MDYRKIFSFRETEDEPRPFVEHLDDLRCVMIKVAITLVVAMFGCFFFRDFLAFVIQWPLIKLDPARAGNLQSLGVADSMTISLELAFYAGMIISFPILIFFLAQFLFPALNKAEKRIIFPLAFLSFFLFLFGINFGYWAVLPGTLDFFFKDAKAMHWAPLWTVREYYSFTTQFLIAFGLAFEMPIIVLALVKLGFLTAATLRKTRSIAIVTIFGIAAFITPSPDLMTYLLMGGPMVLLYEVCIFLARWVEPKTERNH